MNVWNISNDTPPPEDGRWLLGATVVFSMKTMKVEIESVFVFRMDKMVGKPCWKMLEENPGNGMRDSFTGFIEPPHLWKEFPSMPVLKSKAVR